MAGFIFLPGVADIDTYYLVLKFKAYLKIYAVQVSKYATQVRPIKSSSGRSMVVSLLLILRSRPIPTNTEAGNSNLGSAVLF